ncbi:GNAT family N-acetyltransferase [Hymenobacter yonginensis]|uniref:GNAT family N-acetyltransferase n=1 Tax=Hymenobacter yonginensis TaxID=748197 RepID=A0ABY7PR64_9BACT|nr:GNAT family N-acetyltransferase [Hymenobacter yonginensis]WBO85325.1 GNAT family N-acetyltransferase [Hymenobacter yonginensis]
MSVRIEHHPQDQEFIANTGGHTGELAYSTPEEGVIDFIHTFVDEALRGQGVGETLARAGLDYARQHQLRVRTSCKFMAAFVRQHPEFQDLLEAKA